jgi:hypothetical protein
MCATFETGRHPALRHTFKGHKKHKKHTQTWFLHLLRFLSILWPKNILLSHFMIFVSFVDKILTSNPG